MTGDGLMTEIDIKTIDGMFIKQIFVPKAKTLISMHSHVYGHSTLLARGSMLVWGLEPGVKKFSAPIIIYIPAAAKHEYQTLEDETLIYCLHNLHGAEAVALLTQNGLSHEDLDL